MASNLPKVGAQMVLEGEREYREALSKIEGGLKVNYAQMALVSEQAKTMSSEEDALRAKSNALANAINSQREKVAVLADRVAYATKQYGEGSTKTMSYQASLTRAEAQLAKMENTQAEYTAALEESSNAQEEATEKAGESEQGFLSLADVINGVCDAFGIQLPSSLQTAVNHLEGVNAAAAGAVTVVGGLITGLGSLTIETSKTADGLLTLSAQTGLSTDQLQEFQYASELVDVSMETLQGSLTKMTNNMQTAAAGTGSAYEAFKTLGVHVTDAHGKLRDADQVFLEAVDALGKLQNGTERDALAMDIFGRSAQDLNPLILAGSDRLAELAKQAHEVGYVMDNETLQSFGALDDSMQEIDKKFDAVKNTLAQALLPVLSDLADFVSSIPTEAITFIAVAGSAVLVITSVAKAITAVSTAGAVLAPVLTAVGVGAGVAGGGLSAMLPTILLVTAAVLALVGVFLLLKDAFTGTSSASNSMNQTLSQVNHTMANMPRHARGTNFWTGGATWVGEEGPELVELPRGSRIYSAGQSRMMQSRGAGSGDGVYIQNLSVTVDAKNVREFNDIVRIAQNEAVRIRQG